MVRIARVYSGIILFMLKLDSGADVHISPSADNMFNVEMFTADNPCPLRLETTDGSILQCIGRGDLGEFIRGVYVCPEVQTTLISFQELQNIGLGILFPPLSTIRDFGNKVGGLIYNEDIEILGTFSKAYECSAASIHKTGLYIQWDTNGTGLFSIRDGATGLLVSPKYLMNSIVRQNGKRKRTQQVLNNTSVSTHSQLRDNTERTLSAFSRPRGTPAVPESSRSLGRQFVLRI